nr:glycosyltransferase family 4 protein [Sphaerisporangium rubeum]
MPGDVDDDRVPSGGNVYDRRACQGLGALGWTVRQVPLPAAWPLPGDPGGLARSLAALPDGTVVLLDGLVACAMPEVVVPEAKRLRVAVLVHLPLADETGLRPEVAAAMDAAERDTLRAAAAVIATSPHAARDLAARHGLPQVHVAPPGTDPAPPARGTDGASRLLCVAAVTPRKGHDLLVRALGALADWPWTCHCVGAYDRDPGFVAHLRGLIASLGLERRVVLTGPRSGAALAAKYGSADLLVLPSRQETFGMVVTEALARGVPVLTTTAGALPETLGRAPGGEPPGLLVPPGDPAALAGALRRWLDEPDLRRRLRTAAEERRAMLTTWETTSRLLADVLHGLVRR